MCAGMAVLLGPPSVGGACYMVWSKGKERMLRRLKLTTPPPTSFAANASAFLVLVGSYVGQRAFVIRHFDEGGALSLNWKKGTESLGTTVI